MTDQETFIDVIVKNLHVDLHRSLFVGEPAYFLQGVNQDLLAFFFLFLTGVLPRKNPDARGSEVKASSTPFSSH